MVWKKPKSLAFKLNTDASRRGHNTTGGGVVHGASGDLEFGFAMQFTHQDGLQAELDADLHGLQMCAARKLRQVEVENDLAMAYNMILKKSPRTHGNMFTLSGELDAC